MTFYYSFSSKRILRVSTRKNREKIFLNNDRIYLSLEWLEFRWNCLLPLRKFENSFPWEKMEKNRANSWCGSQSLIILALNNKNNLLWASRVVLLARKFARLSIDHPSAYISSRNEGKWYINDIWIAILKENWNFRFIHRELKIFLKECSFLTISRTLSKQARNSLHTDIRIAYILVAKHWKQRSLLSRIHGTLNNE